MQDRSEPMPRLLALGSVCLERPSVSQSHDLFTPQLPFKREQHCEPAELFLYADWSTFAAQKNYIIYSRTEGDSMARIINLLTILLSILFDCRLIVLGFFFFFFLSYFCPLSKSANRNVQMPSVERAFEYFTVHKFCNLKRDYAYEERFTKYSVKNYSKTHKGWTLL